MAGDAIGTYGAGLGLPLDQTKFFTSFTLFAMLLGYVVGLLAIPRLLSQERYLAWSAILGVLLAIGGLGRFTEQGSALLIMGIAGGALIPQLFVHLKDALGFQLVFLLLVVPCYLYILYFATRGHRVGQR